MGGLDCFVADKTSSLEQDLDMYSATEFENLLNETSGQNILDLSLQSSGITPDPAPAQPSWDDDTDDFLKAMLTGSDLSTEISGIGSETVCPSDTSSDSGCPEDRVRTLTSPGLDDGPRYSPCLDYSPLPNSPHSTHSVDLVEYLSNDSDSGEAVSPLTLITDPEIQTACRTTSSITSTMPLQSPSPPSDWPPVTRVQQQRGGVSVHPPVIAGWKTVISDTKQTTNTRPWSSMTKSKRWRQKRT